MAQPSLPVPLQPRSQPHSQSRSQSQPQPQPQPQLLSPQCLLSHWDGETDVQPEQHAHLPSQSGTGSESDSDSDSQADTDSGSNTGSDSDSDSESQSPLQSGSDAAPLTLRWLYQCQLTQQQLQHYSQLMHNGMPSRQLTPSHNQTLDTCGDKGFSPACGDVYHSCSDISSNPDPPHNGGIANNSSSSPHSCNGEGSTKQNSSSAERNPPTVSPVWLPVRSASVNAIKQQDMQQQHDAKRPKWDDNILKQQKQQLPLPPLRFFIRSSGEFASVYLPGSPTGED
ncbi:hypothetical protein MMC08_008883 [Hypocenomyce scalaris]|nr:hypothetical protein [Hypocenomyce scalaris]